MFLILLIQSRNSQNIFHLLDFLISLFKIILVSKNYFILDFQLQITEVQQVLSILLKLFPHGVNNPLFVFHFSGNETNLLLQLEFKLSNLNGLIFNFLLIFKAIIHYEIGSLVHYDHFTSKLIDHFLQLVDFCLRFQIFHVCHWGSWNMWNIQLKHIKGIFLEIFWYILTCVIFVPLI